MHVVEIFLDEVSLEEILDIPIDRIRSMRNQQLSLEFVQSASKVGGNSKTRVRKKSLKRVPVALSIREQVPTASFKEIHSCFSNGLISHESS